MKIKKMLSTFGEGLIVVSQATHDAPIRTRIAELDAEIAKLQEERTKLENQLINRIDH